MLSDISGGALNNANEAYSGDVQRLGELLKQSKRTVIFSGAGMSTESGLLDFRSTDRGMWNGLDPMELASTWALGENINEFTKFYRWRIEEMLRHQPNIGHRILANWESVGFIQGIITQNVENYHEQSGSRCVIKLHGDLGTVRCVRCGHNVPADIYLSGETPRCVTVNCSGLLRPNVVLFGEYLREQALTDAAQLVQDANLLIVVGSSLTVSPANSFPRVVKKTGGRLVIINNSPTPLDHIADLVIRQNISEVLQGVHEEVFGQGEMLDAR
jgi:NAD-dependent deacetylase